MNRSLTNHIARTLIEAEIDRHPKVEWVYQATPWKWRAIRQQLTVAQQAAATADNYFHLLGALKP